MKKLNKIESEVAVWNERFPVDAWWRRKHGIPFMSRAHREVSFLDQLFEFYEQRIIDGFGKESYKPNIGEFLLGGSTVDDLRREFEREFLSEDDG